ncbi:NUDIX hydrolase [Salinibacterium sp. SYSU T00001]|uniref:NUDIX domain-containing protein n=1 Tax=Homoserinimonas sedimenticola TaxID=2986805 RepID=UPI0022363605|nr:NUDIX hydrolase [Salinibacterium sedimenticola]MCW4384161.1 NUDIX hydrolase [Salinibacterium sedimenticola]
MSADAEIDLLADEPSPQRVLESEVAFDGAVWNVRRDRFVYGDGEIVREYVAHTGAVAVLAVDEDGRMLLLKQYRHPIATRDWELPAGLLDVEGEDPLEAAKRELEEEADLAAREWSPLIEFFTSPGGSDELLRVYLARGLEPVNHDFEREGEEADMELRWEPVEAVLEAIRAGRVRNGILVTATLAFASR